MSRKKEYVYLFGLIGVVLLAGCTQAASNEVQGTSTGSDNTSTAASTDDLSTRVEAAFQECGEVRETGIYGDIYMVDRGCLSEQVSSLEQCQEYEDGVVYEGAGRTRRFDAGDVSSCKRAFVKRNADPDLCSQSLEEGLKQQCWAVYAERSKSPETCTEAPLEEELEQRCWSVHIERNKSPELCTAAPNTTECRLRYASRQNLEDACDNTRNRIACLYERLNISADAISTTDYTLCKIYADPSVYTGEEWKDRCLTGLAVHRQDLPLCEQVETELQREECYIDVARTDPSVTLSDCDAGGQVWPACYRSIALRENDSSICQELPTSHQENCFRPIAESTGNISVCTQIEGRQQSVSCANNVANNIPEDEYTYSFCETWSSFEAVDNSDTDRCFYEVGTRTMNVDACNQITDDSARTECRQIVTHSTEN